VPVIRWSPDIVIIRFADNNSDSWTTSCFRFANSRLSCARLVATRIKIGAGTMSLSAEVGIIKRKMAQESLVVPQVEAPPKQQRQSADIIAFLTNRIPTFRVGRKTTDIRTLLRFPYKSQSFICSITSARSCSRAPTQSVSQTAPGALPCRYCRAGVGAWVAISGTAPFRA
jgi:hypothetical protein